MRPVIERCAPTGTRCASPRATSRRRSSCASASASSTRAIGRHRGERLAAKALGLASRSAALVALGARAARARGAARALRHRARPRLQRRHASRPRCCGSPARRCSTTSGRPSSTTSTAAWRAARRRARRDPARAAATATAPTASCSRYAGLKEEYYLADFEPRRGRARRARARSRAADRRRAHAAGGVAVPPLRERPVRRRARAAARGGRRARRACSRCVLPRVDAQRARAARRAGVHRPRARDRRAVADRLRRPRDLRGRHDEPRGGRARHARLHDVRGPPGRGRRAADRRRPAAPADRRRASSSCASATTAGAGPRAPRSARAASSCCCARCGSRPSAPERPLALTIHAMRRRIRSAAFPLHRHSLPQLAVDGVLVALAYYLAFQLRFDNGPHAATTLQLRDRTIWWVLGGSLLGARAGARLPAPLALRRPARLRGARARRSWRSSLLTRRRASRCCARCSATTAHGTHVAIGLPNGVIVLFFAARAGVPVRRARRSRAALYERRPLAAFRGVGARASARVLIAGAGEGGRLVLREIMRNRELGLRAGRLPRRRPAQARGCGSTACACAATPKATCRGSSTRPSPTK